MRANKTGIQKRLLGYTATRSYLRPEGWVKYSAWGITVESAKRKCEKMYMSL